MNPFSSLLDLLYPTRCVFCHRLLYGREEEKRAVCPDCRRALPVNRDGFQTELTQKSIEICCAPLTYQDTVRESLHRYKFGGNRFYARTYGDIICRAFGSGELNCDLITWVPLSRARRRKRGYDQAYLLAREIGRITGIPCVRTLKKIKNIRPQSSMASAEDRKKNISGVYRLDPRCDVRNRTVLLVDDIITTGSTLSEAASVLKAGGAASVKAAAVARA